MLTVTAAASLVAAGFAVCALVVDPSRIGGASGWIKPVKFSLSIALYCATVGWLLGYVQGHRRLVTALAWSTATALLLELALIDLQVARGTTSHFNVATPFDAAVFATMGALVVGVVTAAVVTTALLYRQPLPAPMRVGFRGGLLVCLLGMAEATLMLAHAGHTVGAADGGPGWWFTGWSTQHGDLRIAHFVGLHALQVIPLSAWLLPKVRPSMIATVANRLVAAGSVFYAGIIVLLTWQAERGEPLQRPSPVVLAAGIAWLAAGIGGARYLGRQPAGPNDTARALTDGPTQPVRTG